MQREEKKMQYEASTERIREQEMTSRLQELESQQDLVVTGETTVNDDVIASIVGIAAREIEGVHSLGSSSIQRSFAERIGGAERRARGVEVEAGKKEAIINIDVRVIYGFNIPQIVIELRKRVATRLLELLAIQAKEVNVIVSGIEFPERMPGKLQ